MKNFHKVLVLVDLVVDQNRAVRKLPHTRPLANSHADARESSQQVHVVKQRITKAFGGHGIIFGNVADDFSEVVQCSLREEEAGIHLGRSSRTFSIGTVRPALASSIPSSMAASVTASSSSRIGAGFSKSDPLALAMDLC